jgi:hypothetical protein
MKRSPPRASRPTCGAISATGAGSSTHSPTRRSSRSSIGRTDGVGEALREALEIVRRTENTLGLALVIQARPRSRLPATHPETAARLTGFADSAFTSFGIRRETVTKSVRDALLRQICAPR